MQKSYANKSNVVTVNAL